MKMFCDIVTEEEFNEGPHPVRRKRRKKLKNKVLWCSVHEPTPEQLNSQLLSGGFDKLSDIDEELMGRLANSPGVVADLKKLAIDLLIRTQQLGYETIVQPSGSLAFQHVLATVMFVHDELEVMVAYAHSERQSVDQVQEDGSVRKVSVFRHKHWIGV